MAIPKYRHKRDANESEIVKALRDIPGLTIFPLSAKDLPDLIIGYRHPKTGEPTNYLFEVKNKKGRNKLQEGQSEFIANWQGQVAVVHTLDEILAILGISS